MPVVSVPLTFNLTDPSTLQRSIDAVVPPDKHVAVLMGVQGATGQPITGQGQLLARVGGAWMVGGTVAITKPVNGAPVQVSGGVMATLVF